MRCWKCLVLLLCVLGWSNAQGQTGVVLPPDPPQFSGTVVYANGLITAFVPGLPLLIQSTDGKFSLTIPLSKGAARFLDKNGVATDPSKLKAGARLQAILDDNSAAPVISQIVVEDN